MIVTQAYDLVGHVSGYTVSEAGPIESFSRELLEQADNAVLSYDPVERIATVRGDNGTWRYKMLPGPADQRTLTGTLLGKLVVAR
jgi:hypothetical protein